MNELRAGLFVDVRVEGGDTSTAEIIAVDDQVVALKFFGNDREMTLPLHYLRNVTWYEKVKAE